MKLAQFHEFLENITTKLDGILGIRMIDALTDFIKGDIRDARVHLLLSISYIFSSMKRRISIKLDTIMNLVLNN